MSGLGLSQRAAGLVVLALATGCATTAGAQGDGNQNRITQLETRVDRVERKVDSQSLVEMNKQISALESEVRNLRGLVETLQFELNATRERQRNLYVDLDGRIQALEGGGPRPPASAAGFPSSGVSNTPPAGVAAPAAAVAAPAAAATGSEQGDYQAAFNLLKEGRYGEASEGFASFLAAYPNSNLADNAQYWHAETFYVSREFDKALAAFQKVLQQFPNSRKAPDALLKIGYCNYELQQWPPARQALERVRAEYPDSTAAKLAEQRLTRMNSEGR
jgi:tol-pal system protein YbgF